MNIKPIKAVSILLMVILSSLSFAQTNSYSSNANQQIRYLNYDKDNIFVIDLVPKKGTLLLFEHDEVITDIAIDDSDGFNFTMTTGKNGLFLEYKTPRKTYITVLTDKRAYTLLMNGEFVAKNAKHYAQIKFKYSVNNTRLVNTNTTSSKGKNKNGIAPSLKSSKSTFGKLISTNTKYDINVNYNWRGDGEIKPSKVFDNGLFTFFKFDGEIPSIYAVGKGGYERVLNRHIDGDYVVIHSINKQMTLRLGDYATCIFNIHELKNKKRSIGHGYDKKQRRRIR